MTADRPATEPRTESVTAALNAMTDWIGLVEQPAYGENSIYDEVVREFVPRIRRAIEAEAAQGGAPPRYRAIAARALGTLGGIAKDLTVSSLRDARRVAQRAFDDGWSEVADADRESEGAAPRAEGPYYTRPADPRFAELVRDTSNDPHLVREAERLLASGAAPRAEGHTQDCIHSKDRFADERVPESEER